MMQVRWRLNAVTDRSGQKAKLRFNMNFRKNGPAGVDDVPRVRFDETDRGTGTCVVH